MRIDEREDFVDVVDNVNIGRSVDETLRVLQALQSGGLCASDWKPGQKTLGAADTGVKTPEPLD